MKTLSRRNALALGAAASLAAASPIIANDSAIITAFYSEYLSADGPKDKAAVAARILAPDWKSVGDYSGKANSPEGLTRMLGGFHQLMPDLKWEVVETIQAGNRFVVRGKASGTPKAPFFGVDGQGRGFTIMSIDIHTVRDGKIAESYHVEDWAGAMRQLSGR